MSGIDPEYARFIRQLKDRGQLAILAEVAEQNGQAYGVSIQDAFKAKGGKSLSYASIYLALDALETLGLVYGLWGEATPARGGRRKRLYGATFTGLRVVKHAKEAGDA